MLFFKEVLTPAEAAVALGYSSTQTIYKLIHSNKLDAYKLPGHHRWNITRKSLDAFVDYCMRKYAYINRKE